MDWLTMWRQLQLTPPANLADELHAAYNQQHRFYHGLQHLQECLSLLTQVEYLADQPAEIALALYFHDAVYDIHAHDNEAQSAAWASHVLLICGASAQRTERIHHLIMATCHQAQPDDADSQLLVDIDLAILGQNPARFAEYEQQIRQEYSWVDAEAFRQGRAAVLKSFADREFIYNTGYFRQHFEQQARLNLQTALAALS